MLQTSLAAALLAASTGPAGNQDALIQLLPPGSPVVISVGDVAGRLSAEDPGMWMSLATDERIRSAMLELTEVGEEFADQGFEQFLDVLSKIRGGGFAVTDLESDGAVGVLRVADGFVPALRTLVETGGEELVEAEVLGRPGYRVEAGPTDSMSIVEVSGALLLGLGAEDGVESDLGAIIAAMEDGPDEEPWWFDAGITRVGDPMMEIFVAFDVVAELDDEFASLFPAATLGYFGFGVGEGREGEMAFSGGLGQHDLLWKIGEASGEVDPDLLAMAPPGVVSAAVANVDVLALIDAGLELADEPAAREQYEAAMEAGSATLGVDLEDEILGNLTGDMFFAQWDVAPDTMDSEDPADLIEASPAIALGIEDSEPFYTLIETAEPFLGPDGVDTEDTDAGTMWTTEPVPGAPIAVGLSETMVFLGAADRVEDLMARAAGGAKAGMLDESQIAFAKETLTGSYAGAADMATMWTLFEFGMRLGAEESGDEFPPELELILEAAAERLDGMIFADMVLTPSEIGMRMLTR